MGNENLYGPYGQTGNSPRPRMQGQTQNGVQPPQTPGSDMDAKLQAIFQAQLAQQQNYFANQHRHLGIDGQEIAAQPNGPWGEPLTFKTAAQRQEVERSRGDLGWATPPQAQDPATFGQQTHSNPFIMPPAPQRNAQGNIADPNKVMQDNAALYTPGGYAPPPQTFSQPNMSQPGMQFSSLRPRVKPRGRPMRPGSSFGF